MVFLPLNELEIKLFKGYLFVFSILILKNIHFMSATTFKVSAEYFTPEKTQEFLLEHEAACQKMDVVDFLNIYIKYDLSFVKEYEKVITSIVDALTGWKNEKLGTKIIEVSTFNSNCIFCEIGKKVKVYRWTYTNTLEEGIKNRIVYERKIGFRFEMKEGRLIEYGICNAYL